MKWLESIVRERPYLAVALGLGSLSALILSVWGVVLAATPDPTVRTLPMRWQQIGMPVVNGGVDAQGRTLDQFVSGGGDSRDWRPVELKAVAAGGLFYTLRYQEFRNKLAEPKINRLLLCGRVTQVPGQPPIVDNDGLTPFDLGAVDAPTRTDGAAVKNHPTRIPEYVGRDASGAPLTAPRTCVYKATAKFMKNPVQSVEIIFAPVAVTILPPANAAGARTR